MAAQPQVPKASDTILTTLVLLLKNATPFHLSRKRSHQAMSARASGPDGLFNRFNEVECEGPT